MHFFRKKKKEGVEAGIVPEPPEYDFPETEGIRSLSTRVSASGLDGLPELPQLPEKPAPVASSSDMPEFPEMPIAGGGLARKEEPEIREGIKRLPLKLTQELGPPNKVPAKPGTRAVVAPQPKPMPQPRREIKREMNGHQEILSNLKQIHKRLEALDKEIKKLKGTKTKAKEVKVDKLDEIRKQLEDL